MKKIESWDRLLYFFFELQKSCTEHFVSQHGVTRGALLLKLSEQAGLVCIKPFRRHQAHYPVAVAFPIPKRDNFLFIDFFYSFINTEEYFFPCVKNIKILQWMQVYLRIRRSSFGWRSPLTHNKFTFINAYRFVFQKIFKCFCPFNRSRQLTGFIAFVKLRYQQRSFGAYFFDCIQTLLS